MRSNNDRLVEGKINSSMTLREAGEVWINVFSFEVSNSRFVANRTVKDFRQRLVALYKHFGDIRLRGIVPEDVRDYQQKRAAGEYTPEEAHRGNMRGPGAGPGCINKETELLRRILVRAKAWTAPMQESYVLLKVDGPDIPRALSPEQEIHFLNVAASKPEWEIVYWYSTFALHTCMSTQEIRGLRRRRINVEQGIVTVSSSSAKNKYRIRSIELSDSAKKAALWLLDRAEKLGARMPDHFVFPFRSKRGEWDPSRGMSGSGIKKPFDQVRRAADVPWFRPYDLRHTGITRYMEAGTPIAVVMDFAGHVSAAMNAHYTHISQQARRQAANREKTVSSYAHALELRHPAESTTRREDKGSNGGSINLPSLIANLKAKGLDAAAILEVIQASS